MYDSNFPTWTPTVKVHKMVSTDGKYTGFNYDYDTGLDNYYANLDLGNFTKEACYVFAVQDSENNILNRVVHTEFYDVYADEYKNIANYFE